MIPEKDAILLRLALDGFVPAPLPSGFRFACFRGADAKAVENLLVAARADGLAGDAERQVGWFERVRRDPAWDADLVILVRRVAQGGGLVAVAHSWTETFLKDLAVDAEHRRLGVAQALVGATAQRFAARGFPHLDLKVRPANAPARRLYARLGFRPLGE